MSLETLGHDAVDSQLDMLGDCDGSCNDNQGRGACACMALREPDARLVLLATLLPLAGVACGALAAFVWGAPR